MERRFDVRLEGELSRQVGVELGESDVVLSIAAPPATSNGTKSPMRTIGNRVTSCRP